MADLFDAMAANPERTQRRCPKCLRGDVKFATHDSPFVGTSAACADCKHWEMSGDPLILFLRWTISGTPSGVGNP